MIEVGATLRVDLDRRTHDGGLIANLNAEWVHVHPRVSEALERWAGDWPILAQYTLEPGTQARLTHDEADAYLLALLEQAQQNRSTDAELAARTVLQLMLPSVVRVARGRRCDGIDEAEASAVAAMYEAIVSYPVDRRPRYVAANLTFDALRTEHRHAAAGELITGTEVLLDPIPCASLDATYDEPGSQVSSPSEELARLLLWAVHRQVLTAAEATLLIDGTAYGWSRRFVHELGISAGAIRQRRRVALAKLRAAVADYDPETASLTRSTPPVDAQGRSAPMAPDDTRASAAGANVAAGSRSA